MINYSIFSAETLFDDWDEFDPQYQEMELGEGITLLVERIDPQQVRINRIISSNPQAFLKNEIFPGTILKTGLQI